MSQLATNLPDDAKAAPKLAEAFRRLVKSVTVTPTDEGKWLVQVERRLSSLIGDALLQTKRNAMGEAVVAEEGLEPPTQGL